MGDVGVGGEVFGRSTARTRVSEAARVQRESAATATKREDHGLDGEVGSVHGA